MTACTGWCKTCYVVYIIYDAVQCSDNYMYMFTYTMKMLYTFDGENRGQMKEKSKNKVPLFSLLDGAFY